MVDALFSDRGNGYEGFFGFGQTPFSLAPDTRFRFQSASHAAALAQVTYALERREPVVVVTGEIGTGKTLLCRTIVERLERKTFLSIVNDPLLERDELLKQMLQDFGVVSRDRTRLSPTSRHDLIHALQEFVSSLSSLQAHAVVIIDEAQHVQSDVLEQIRLVSNMQDERGTMLQIILVGQTDLERLLSQPELRPLNQRVCRFVRIDALSAAEVAQYIGHRLAVARQRQMQSRIPGARELARELAEWERPNSDPTFTPDAVAAVAKLSRGIPRVVNLLCDRSLEAAHARRSRIVDASFINTAAQMLDLPGTPGASAATLPLSREPAPTGVLRAPFSSTDAPRRSRSVIVAASLVLVLAGAAIWFGGRTMNRPGNREPASRPASTVGSTTVPHTAPTGAALPLDISNQPAAAGATMSPVSEATDTSAASGPSTGEAFEIVIASFRTAARAADVVADVAALGLPVRRRTAAGWQQVLAGPYASAAQAREAQQHLERAGFKDIQLVSAAR